MVLVIVPISLVFILVLLYGLFNSLRDSLMALAGIPFAVAGGIIALYVTDLDFSVSAAIGFVSLFMVSVMDGILMIIYYNQVRHSGMDATDVGGLLIGPIMLLVVGPALRMLFLGSDRAEENSAGPADYQPAE
jgi:cobalt-zinc-cadmium resistance protein CzcA